MAELDSQKIEKLLNTATNERQRKMYQALLKKARSQEKEAASSSGTEKKAKAQAILGKVEKQETVASRTGKKAITQEQVLASSTQSEVNNETLNLPKLESTVSSSKTDTEIKTQTLENTSKATAENNKKSEAEKSSNNQKQAEDKKAQSNKQKGSKKKTQKTKKVQEEKPIFQALGRMVLTPYLKENELKVEIEGQEHDLLHGSGSTLVAHRKLRQELIKNGSKKMLLMLYPLTQFSPNSSSVKLSFIVGKFEKKYNQERKYGSNFRLKGILQYIPWSETPVISIYRNRSQLWQFKKLNEEKRLKLAKPNHIPVLWENAPVAPFKYVEGVSKKEQMPRYFVEVRAVLQDGMYVVKEMLREPTLDIPLYIKGEKVKDYDFKNSQSYFNSSNSKKTNSSKFQFILRGKILIEDEMELFELENGTKFTVKEILVDSYPEGITEWQVVPVINNDAQIVSLILEKSLAENKLVTSSSKMIIGAGEIIEIGKIDDRFKVKIRRSKAKVVKITVVGKQPEMKVGQLWDMKLALKEGSLWAEELQYIQD